MPRIRPSRPTPVRQIAAPKVADAETARAISDVATAVREEQRDPKIPRSGPSGETYYRKADGTIAALSIGTAGQALTVTDGIPSWTPGLPFTKDWGSVPAPAPASLTVQHRRGTTADHAGFTGALGEVTVDTSKDVAVIHDGATAGGFPSITEAVWLATNRYTSVILPHGVWNGSQATNRALLDLSLKVTYMGRCPRQLRGEPVTVRLRTTAPFVAGTTGTTWAEVAIATGVIVPGGAPSLTFIAYADAAPFLVAPNGLKNVVIQNVTLDLGADWWLAIGNSFGAGGGATDASLRSLDVGDDLVIGIQGTIANVRPSANIGIGTKFDLVVDANNVNALWMAAII